LSFNLYQLKGERGRGVAAVASANGVAVF
jgi:hypothetical protein